MQRSIINLSRGESINQQNKTFKSIEDFVNYFAEDDSRKRYIKKVCPSIYFYPLSFFLDSGGHKRDSSCEMYSLDEEVAHASVRE